MLSQGGDTCAFRWNGFALENEEREKAYAEKKAALGDRTLKDFLYHTGHLLSAMKQALTPHLDGQYAAFGKVVEGLDVVDRIAAVRTNPWDKPLQPVVMKSVVIE